MKMPLEDAYALLGCIVDELDSEVRDRAADANLEAIARALLAHIEEEAPPVVVAAIALRLPDFGRPPARSEP
jgi:hypothetical protein